MPIGRADFQIDPSNLAASSTDVTLRADKVRTGFFLVTGILKGASMLDTTRYPTIRFVSTAVRPGPVRSPDGRSEAARRADDTRCDASSELRRPLHAPRRERTR